MFVFGHNDKFICTQAYDQLMLWIQLSDVAQHTHVTQVHAVIHSQGQAHWFDLAHVALQR